MKNSKVDQTVYDTIKFMSNGGATLKQCAVATGVSTCTVTLIRNSNTLEEYKNRLVNYKKANSKKKQETPVEPPVETKATEPTPQIIDNRITLIANQFLAEQIKKQTELLELINNKLTLIAEDLGCFRDEKIGG